MGTQLLHSGKQVVKVGRDCLLESWSYPESLRQNAAALRATPQPHACACAPQPPHPFLHHPPPSPPASNIRPLTPCMRLHVAPKIPACTCRPGTRSITAQCAWCLHRNDIKLLVLRLAQLLARHGVCAQSFYALLLVFLQAVYQYLALHNIRRMPHLRCWCKHMRDHVIGFFLACPQSCACYMLISRHA